MSKINGFGKGEGGQLQTIDLQDVVIDDEEIDRMILQDTEKEFKSRVWNKLNSQWIKE